MSALCHERTFRSTTSKEVELAFSPAYPGTGARGLAKTISIPIHFFHRLLTNETVFVRGHTRLA